MRQGGEGSAQSVLEVPEKAVNPIQGHGRGPPQRQEGGAVVYPVEEGSYARGPGPFHAAAETQAAVTQRQACLRPMTVLSAVVQYAVERGPYRRIGPFQEIKVR